LSELTIYTDDVEFVVADSPEAAQEAWNDTVGEDQPYNDNKRGWYAKPRDEEFPFYSEGPHGAFDKVTIKTCGEWADSTPDFYATTEF
jgi:hypothetical protein